MLPHDLCSSDSNKAASVEGALADPNLMHALLVLHALLEGLHKGLNLHVQPLFLRTATQYNEPAQLSAPAQPSHPPTHPPTCVQLPQPRPRLVHPQLLQHRAPVLRVSCCAAVQSVLYALLQLYQLAIGFACKYGAECCCGLKGDTRGGLWGSRGCAFKSGAKSEKSCPGYN